jgi:hypothetical protein
VVKERHRPARRRMALCTAVLCHFIPELPLVEVDVARLTSESFEHEHLHAVLIFLVTIIARGRNVSAGECKLT